jgi:DUF4097 and DUF4098 domain-containing protein YvlB
MACLPASVSRRLTMRAVLSLALAAAPGLALAADYQGQFERTLKVSGPVDLTVSSGSGSITVQPSSDGSVRVVGRIYANTWRRMSGSDVMDRVKKIEAQPPIVQDGSRITIGKQDDSLYENISISYDLMVPAATALNVNTGSGSIRVGALRGPVDTHSGSGSIEIGATGGAVKASTGSGQITVDGAKGQLEARSGSGSIHLRGIAGNATVDTGSGSIEVEQTAAGTVQLTNASGSIKAWGVRGGLTARSSSGSIRIQGTPTDPWDVHTSSGSIHLDLPNEAKFTLRAQTGSGSINVDHPVTVQGSIDKHRLEGSVRGGGPTISARTSSGSIDINSGGGGAIER